MKTCTYKQISKSMTVPSCHKEVEWVRATKDYIYCPNCGKKVERVEVNELSKAHA